MDTETDTHEKRGASDNGIRCEVINSVTGINAVRDVWTSLQMTLPIPSAKNDVDYFIAEVSRANSGMVPRIIVVSDGGVPKLLAIACIKEIFFRPQIGYFPIGIFARKPKKCLHVLPYGILGSTEERFSRALVRAMLSMLREKVIDYVYMSLVPADSPLAVASRSMPSFPCRDYMPGYEDHYTLATPESLDAFLKEQTSKTRSRLKGIGRKLSEAFGNDTPPPPQVKWYCGAGDVDEFCRQAEKVAHKSYHRSIGVGFKDSPETRRQKKLEAEKGWFCGCILFAGGGPIAFHSGITYGPSYFLETTAFDPAMKEYNAGTFLDLNLIDRLSKDRKIRIIDFGFGPDEYKKRFSNSYRREVSLRIFQPSLTGISMNALATACEAITRGGRSFARWSGLYPVLKKTVRKLLSRNKR